MSSAGRVLQPPGCNAVHSCRPPDEQEETSRVCGRLSALCCRGLLLLLVACSLDPAICRAGGLCCCCVIHACCHRYNITAAAGAVRFSWAAGCSREFQPLLRYILFYFCKYYPTTTVLCVPCATRACAVCHSRNVFQLLFLSAVLGFLCGRRLLRRESHNKDMHQHTDGHHTTFGGIKKIYQSDSVNNINSSMRSTLFPGMFSPQQAGSVLRGSIVHVYIYSSNMQTFHNIVMSYHMPMICMLYRFQLVLAPLPQARRGRNLVRVYLVYYIKRSIIL